MVASTPSPLAWGEAWDSKGLAQGIDLFCAKMLADSAICLFAPVRPFGAARYLAVSIGFCPSPIDSSAHPSMAAPPTAPKNVAAHVLRMVWSERASVECFRLAPWPGERIGTESLEGPAVI